MNHFFIFLTKQSTYFSILVKTYFSGKEGDSENTTYLNQYQLFKTITLRGKEKVVSDVINWLTARPTDRQIDQQTDRLRDGQTEC